jgi:hypothetical protein
MNEAASEWLHGPRREGPARGRERVLVNRLEVGDELSQLRGTGGGWGCIHSAAGSLGRTTIAR